MSTRVDTLNEAARLTAGDRDATYGDPVVQHSCMGELMAVFDKYNKTSNPAHRAAMFLVLNKVSRITCGKLKDDNYIDGAAYFGIANETRDGERNAFDTTSAEPVPVPAVRRKLPTRKAKRCAYKRA